MFHLNTENDSGENVYVSVPHGIEIKHLVANLQNLTVSANIILGLRCFIRTSVTILEVILGPPDWELAISRTPVIFIRFPDNTVLGGVLHPLHSLVPSYVV